MLPSWSWTAATDRPSVPSAHPGDPAQDLVEPLHLSGGWATAGDDGPFDGNQVRPGCGHGPSGPAVTELLAAQQDQGRQDAGGRYRTACDEAGGRLLRRRPGLLLDGCAPGRLLPGRRGTRCLDGR